jgi:hypothetical protein
MKLEFSQQIFEKISNSKFNQNPPSGSRVVPQGRMENKRYPSQGGYWWAMSSLLR